MDYIINGSSLRDIYNTESTNAVPLFWPMPDKKQSVRVDLPDMNGVKIDTESPRFSARQFTLSCVMSGLTILEVKNTWFGLFSLLRIGGLYSMYNDYVDMTIYVTYSKQQNLTAPYQNSNGGLSIRFDLLFEESDPFINIPNVFLVDESNRFLVP